MAEKSKTTTNLPENVSNALCYAPFFIGGVAAVVFLIVEKNTTVRWNAVQGLLLMVALWLLSFVMGITIILAVLVPLVWVAGLILQLVLVVKAYQGGKVKLPLLANWTDQILKKV